MYYQKKTASYEIEQLRRDKRRMAQLYASANYYFSFVQFKDRMGLEGADFVHDTISSILSGYPHSHNWDESRQTSMFSFASNCIKGDIETWKRDYLRRSKRVIGEIPRWASGQYIEKMSETPPGELSYLDTLKEFDRPVNLERFTQDFIDDVQRISKKDPEGGGGERRLSKRMLRRELILSKKAERLAEIEKRLLESLPFREGKALERAKEASKVIRCALDIYYFKLNEGPGGATSPLFIEVPYEFIPTLAVKRSHHKKVKS